MIEFFRAITIFLVALLLGFTFSGVVPFLTPKSLLGSFSTASYIGGCIAGVTFTTTIVLFYKD